LWASGRHPFTFSGYAAVLVPVAVVGVCMLTAGRGRPAPDGVRARVSLRQRWFWIVLIGAGLVLEAVALALGGRSPRVPTLSTVADQALRWREMRFALFCCWLALAGPLVRRRMR
jgi:hypothetical protein